MAIHFKRIKWKNFLSTGDNFTEIDLNTGTSTLIVGPNGAGKSTLLDALSFALFGKPHREINKPQLINSVNAKNCEVEVEFSVGKVDFRVRRGIKPSIFEIWQNGTLVNQESHSLDYQKVLEQNILKLNHKSFHQIVVLGSSSFIPFMQLPSQHRREVIEDLLDINIFTKMNGLLKERTAKLRDQLGALVHEEDITKRTIDLQQKLIAEINNRNSEQTQRNLDKIREHQAEIDSLMQQNGETQKQIDSSPTHSTKKLTEKRDALLSYQTQIKSNIQRVVKEAKFYEENDNCPTCSQIIAIDFKNEKIHKCKETSRELLDGQNKLADELNRVNESLDQIQKSVDEIVNLQHAIRANNSSINRLQRLIRDLEKENANKQDASLDDAEQKLRDLLVLRDKLSTDKSSAYEHGAYNQAMSEMLKDTGIKTKIIRQYLPVMNKLINGYLQTLDFFVAFNLDEAFEETIKSRHRDDFSYASFSEGEKQRIDLALLFTWRQIARMKNSVSTNLLILDETFDSSMDTDGVENLLKILRTLDEGTSVFIISHKTDALDGKFPRKIEFEKVKNFSQIKQK
jgi:DNA repair exonuclease SbcCD ATPase subunit